MDDGYVIPRLNENWNFIGATPMEWCCGLVAGILFQELFLANMGRNMPLILLVMVGTPMLLATLRKTFPDEERGLRNYCMVRMGFQPPDIPAPAIMQPVWSGMPMRDMDDMSQYQILGLDEVFYQLEER
jgi:hypothetical protein